MSWQPWSVDRSGMLDADAAGLSGPRQEQPNMESILSQQSISPVINEKVAPRDSPIVSLAAADDEATAELMRLFYQRMLGKQQLRPAAALRHMQIEMWRSRSKWSVPYYWAAFTLQGEWK